MHYTGQVYRPPVEAYTPMLEITIGCSHNKCAFCTMYRQTPFRVSPLKDVENDLRELKGYYGPDIKRLYLLNGDPFVLSTEKLLEIADLVHKYFPKVETLSCYASINEIRNRSVDELKTLRAAGYNDLYFGLETAYDPALAIMNKGFTTAEEYENLKKIQDAGMTYRALLMPGVAGRGNGEINALETAKLLNTYKPNMVLIFTTSIAPGSDLAKIRDEGGFVEATEREILEEIKLLLKALDMDDDCFFFGSHPFDLVPVSGYFRDKEQIIQQLDDGMKKLHPKILDGVYKRGAI
ncbi:MAG: radical SAM protein [Oscillospiraceae bacterium]|nr:radical SAM protein [Oscillospiraceae bacterium]